MPNYSLELELYSVLNASTSDFEIWADGVQLGGGYTINATATSVIVPTVSFGGSLPTSLEFRFNDLASGSVDQIEVRSVKINDMYVNTSNYLSSDVLNDGGSATVNITNADFIFDSSDPASSEFTTGATRTFTAGNDKLRAWSSSTDEIFDALAGNDVIWLGSGNDKVSGSAGNDTIRGGGGNDLIFGGADQDRIWGGAGADRLYGGTGNDRIHGDAGDDEIYGGDGDDVLNGHGDNDIITGGIGNDIIHGGDGNDDLWGEAGADRISAGNGIDTVDGGAGADILYGGAGADVIHGGDDDDIIVGDEGDDVLHGDDGDDEIYGRADNDTIYGGTGNDFANGEDGNDTLYGGDGIDVLVGGAGADTLNGGDGNDTLHGHGLTLQEISIILTANPNVSFNRDTNSFYEYVSTSTTWLVADPAAAASTINGTAGHLVNITSQAENDYITAFNTGYVWTGGTDELVDGEWFWSDGAEAGGYFSNVGTPIGNIYENWNATQPAINGEHYAATRGSNGWYDRNEANSNSYVIEWDAGLINDDNSIDTLNGGAGDDIIYGYGGADILDGDAGDDIIFGGEGDDTITGDVNVNTQVGADTLYGGGGNDTIFGYRGNDNIYGGTGNDIIFGGTGADTVYGGTGNDTIDGDGAGDIIYGGEGDDIIDGGSGQDKIYGGIGSDTIMGGNNPDEIYLANGDFGAGESIDGGDLDDELILVDATTVDFTTGTLQNIETLTGSDDDQDVTYTIQQALDFTTIDLAGGTDTSRVQISGTVDVTALGTPTVTNVENGHLTGSTGNDDLTITGAQLDALVFGSGTINFDTGTDVLNLTSNSTYLDGASVANGDLVGLEEIDASSSGGAVSLRLKFQNEDLTVTTSDFGDFVNTGNGNDVITGGVGDDDLRTEQGDDVINAGAGDDNISAGQGVDTVDAGSGNDTFGIFSNTFEAGEFYDGGADIDDLRFATNPTVTVDFTVGTIQNFETMTGRSADDDVTIRIDQLSQFTSVDLGTHTAGDTMRVQIDGVYDAVTNGVPTITNVENGFLVGSANADTLTITGAQLDSLIYGSGTIDMGGSADIINLTSTSADLNTLGATDGSIVGLETIDASTAATGVTVNLSGQTEDFVLIGGVGADILTGGTGADTFTGGGDDDSIRLANGDFSVGESIDGGAGYDEIWLTNATTVNFTTGSISTIELLFGSAGNDDVTIGAATLMGDFTDIDLSGGTNTLTVNVDGAVDLTGASAPLITNVQNSDIMGSGGNDTLTVAGGHLDTLLIGSSAIDFGGGNDTLNIIDFESTDLNVLGTGADADIVGLETISATMAIADVVISVSGQSEDFTLTGSNFYDTITGGSGDDTITGGIGDDTIDGGGGVGDTVIFSGDWADYTITLGGSTYTVVDNVGTDGTDTVVNVENFQFADGTLGDDVLIKPTITSNGAGATATVSIAENTTAVTTVTATNPNLGGGALTYSISGGADSSFFSINGTTGALTFTSAPDYETPLDSGSNNTYDVTVTTSDGTHTDEQNISVSITDVAEGDVGNTPGTAGTLNVGESVLYTVDASGDRDWFAVTLTSGTKYAFWARGTPSEAANSTDPRIYNLYESDGTTSVGANDDGGIGYESLLYYTATYTGTYYIDAGAWGGVTGSILLSAFVGGNTTTGAGTVNGGANADYLIGTGTDTLNGNGGSDILEGGANNDTLDGGAGADVLYGGTGADTFLFNHTDASDSIVDFTTAQGDVLDISGILVGWNAGTDDIDDYLQFQTVGGDTVVRADVDGLVGGSNFVEIAVLEGNTGEVVQTLYDNGDIIA